MEYSRKKSCTQCRTAKTRCSLDLPACARCTKRSLGCSYEFLPRVPNVSIPVPVPASAPVSATPFHTWLLGTKQSPVADGCPIYGAVQHVGNLFSPSVGSSPDSRPSVKDVGASVEESSSMDWSRDDISLSTNRTLASDAQDAVAVEGTLESDKASSLASPSIRRIERSIEERPSPAIANAEVNCMTTPIPELRGAKFILAKWDVLKLVSNKTDHILTRRPITKLAELLKGNLLQSTFESYTFKFDRNEFPPFIHRNHAMKDIESQKIDFKHLPYALANCKAVLPMYLHETRCRPVVIKTMLLEVQRIHDEFRTYDDDKLLHSMQALAIYLILLARDSQRYDLISIVTRITISEIATLAHKKKYLSLDPNHVFSKWEDWVREESRIRTALLVFLMIRLVDMDVLDPTRTPCFGFENVPLPSSRLLWEANSISQWDERYKAYLASRKRPNGLKINDLRQSLDADVEGLDLDMVHDLSNWSKDVDEFGGLVLNCGLLAK